jgi:hypothetical protein
MRFLSLMLLFNLIDITILCPQFMIDAGVSNIKISIVMGRILKCFLVQFALFMLAGTASSQVLLSGVFHETGVGYDGQWQQLGGPGIPFDVMVYENEIQYGSFKGVRRGNANVHGFAGRRYNLVNSDGEVKTHYIVVADNGAIIRVLEVTVDSGPVPGFGFSVGYTSVMAYMTARGYPGSTTTTAAATAITREVTIATTAATTTVIPLPVNVGLPAICAMVPECGKRSMLHVTAEKAAAYGATFAKDTTTLTIMRPAAAVRVRVATCAAIDSSQ